MKSSKAKTVYVCQSCGMQSPRWMGKCPDCGQWNTLVEERVEKQKDIGAAKRGKGPEPLALHEITIGDEDRFVTRIGELTAGKAVVLRRNGREEPLPAGFVHF